MVNPRVSQARLRAAIDALERCGARRIVENRIEELVSGAQLALRAGRIGREATALLEGAACALTERGD